MQLQKLQKLQKLFTLSTSVALLLLTLITTLSLPVSFAQTTVNPPAVNLNAEAVTAINGWLLTQTTTPATTLTIDIDNTTTTVIVADGAGLNNKTILIGTEAMVITARSGKTLTVTRGVLGTTAVLHSKDDAVRTLMYDGIRALAKAIVINNLKHIATNLNPMATIATKKSSQQTLETEIKSAIDTAIQ